MTLVGSLLCLPWFAHNYRTSGKNKEKAKAMLNAIGIYPAVGAVLFGVVIRLAMAAIELLAGFM